jgi:L-lysine exporter family protein LysE/ArgO
MHNIFLEGFLLQASLILALGAQNIFVIEAGIKKQNHLIIAFVCFLCDFVLVIFGILGASKLFTIFPLFKSIIGAFGVLFLFYYAIVKLKEAVGSKAIALNDLTLISKKQSVVNALAFSLLNPHVYLDTVVLIGGYSSKYSIVSDKMSFGLGVVGFSFLWFFLLAIASQYLKDFLNSKQSMRCFSFGSAIVLIYLSYSLGLDVLN